MDAWGAVAGLATITGPRATGVLMETLGRQWIFSVNLPLGALSIVLTLLMPAWRPGLQPWSNPLGVAPSGIELFCVTFGVQNGEQYLWGTVSGFVTVTEIIGAGVVFLLAFVWRQRHNRNEPFAPLQLFGTRIFPWAISPT